jgi:AcrR family transcriptional regulator
MGTRERRARAREETRERIIDAAREMFAEKGLEAVTMRAIAERIEYTPTAIYHHFRDKAELITELCYLDFRSLAQHFQRIGKITDPVERVRRIGLAYVDFALEHPSAYQVMFMMRTPPKPDLLEKGNPDEDAYEFLRATVAEGIAAGRFRPELDDDHALAQLLWGGLHGIVSLHIAKEHDLWVEWRDVRETARTMVEVQLRGTLREEGPA